MRRDDLWFRHYTVHATVAELVLELDIAIRTEHISTVGVLAVGVNWNPAVSVPVFPEATASLSALMVTGENETVVSFVCI
jgi:hypothetical protein